LDTQIKEKTVRATRESQDKRQEVYVATWHFDKRVLSSLEDGFSCEVVYSRVTQVEKLAGIMKREWFHHCESLIGWAHGRANLCYGHLQQINDTNSVE
jgi:hypothetical protein